MTLPSFSIICPVYNKADFIRSAIDSVLNQSYPHFELLVINDCSTDESLSLAQSYSDPRIIVSSVPNKNGGGGYYARNYGVSLASNKWLCFLDADDIYLPNHLSCLSDLISTFPDDQYFCTNWSVFTNNSYQFFPNVQHLLDQSIRLSAEKCIDSLASGKEYFHTNSVCILKSFFAKTHGFPEYNNSCMCSGDGALFLFLSILNEGIILSPVISTVYRRISSNSIIKSFIPLKSNCLLNSLSSYTYLADPLQEKLRLVQTRKSSSILLRHTLDHKVLPFYVFSNLRYTGFNIRSLLSIFISFYNYLLSLFSPP